MSPYEPRRITRASGPHPGQRTPDDPAETGARPRQRTCDGIRSPLAGAVEQPAARAAGDVPRGRTAWPADCAGLGLRPHVPQDVCAIEAAGTAVREPVAR